MVNIYCFERKKTVLLVIFFSGLISWKRLDKFLILGSTICFFSLEKQGQK